MTDNPRRPEAPIDPRFLDRWSPRSFLPTEVPDETLRSLFEAARWAPSCFNEQPWRFVFARETEDRARFLSLLAEANRAWAGKAPVLAFVAAHRSFTRNGKPNRHHAFDAGAAWLSLALEARRHDLYAHAMAGFDEARSYEVLGLDREDWVVLAAIAIGHRGPVEALPEAKRAAERPNDRLPLATVVSEGRFEV